MFLLVDHLDRLVEEPTGEYWVDQLARLPRWGWLHTVLACRPEEYGRYLQGPLHKAFRPAKLISQFGGVRDTGGHWRPKDILEQIHASRDQLDIAACLAQSFGHQRFRLVSGVEETALAEANFWGRRLFSVERGRGRFAHDAVQDALSAAGLVFQLAKHRDDVPNTTAICRNLQDLPRDVPRMLFDLLAARKVKHLPSRLLKEASEGLVRGLLREPSTLEWLNNTGRQEQSYDALMAFDAARGRAGEARLLSKMLLGHGQFMRCRIQLFMDRKKCWDEIERHAVPSIRNLAEGACVAEELIARMEPGKDEAKNRQWYLTRLLFLVDHMMVLLGRMFTSPHVEDFTINLARDLSGMFRLRKDPAPLEEGWLRSLLEELCRARGQDDADNLMQRIYKDAKEVAKSEKPKGFLDVRLCYAAGHVGNRMLEHVFSREPRPPDRAKLGEARKWNFIAIAGWERVYRRMAEEQEGPPVECLGTKAQALADLGAQWRAAFETQIFEVPCGPVTRNLVNRILVAHRNHENIWRRVDRQRMPAERLPVQYQTVLAALISGRLVERIVRERIAPADAEKVLKEISEEVADDYLSKAENHPRWHDDGLIDAKKLWDQPRRILGSASALTEALLLPNKL